MGGVIRVVVVDDLHDMRSILRSTFDADHRFRVVGVAATSAEAIRCCAERRPDAVVLDADMPVLGGLDPVRLIRARSPHTTIVALADRVDASATLALSARGVAQVVPKATWLADLPHVVAQVFGR